MTITVSPLFVDKLTITYCGQESHEEGERELFIAYITSTMRDLRRKDGGLVSSRGLDSARRYKQNWRVAISGAENRPVLLSTDPMDREAAPFRMEYNPRYYSPIAADNLWQFIQENIAIEDFDYFLDTAEITRIDLACDIYPLSPDSLMVFATHLHKGDIRTGPGGKIQSFVLGSNHSALSYCIYDRDPEDRSLISPTPYTTRIEARLRRPCRIRDLHALNSPFMKLHVYGTVNPESISRYPLNRRLFLDSAARRGLQGALRYLQRHETQQNYIAWLEQECTTDWFDSNQIWLGFPAAYNALRIPISPPREPGRRRRRRRR